ncbi:hypothetical protein ACTJKF_22185 [Burkholderia sp. 22313]
MTSLLAGGSGNVSEYADAMRRFGESFATGLRPVCDRRVIASGFREAERMLSRTASSPHGRFFQRMQIAHASACACNAAARGIAMRARCAARRMRSAIAG